jgi:nucleoside recognition membrane protein YjiH
VTPNQFGEITMFKKLLLTAIAVGLVSAFSIQITPAEAAMHSMVGMTCKNAAKMQYPNDRKTRRAFKKACKQHWKATQGK